MLLSCILINTILIISFSHINFSSFMITSTQQTNQISSFYNLLFPLILIPIHQLSFAKED